MRGALAPPFVALGFLTIIPTPLSAAVSLSRSIAYFPAVGALLGALVAAFDLAATAVFPRTVASVLDIAAFAVLSGGLHLDGLADTADGVFARGDPAARLAVMRDSRAGAFAAAAVTLVLLLETAALSAIAAPLRPAALVSAGALSRWAMAIVLVGFPNARSDGLAAAVRAGARPAQVGVATALAALVAAALLGAGAVAGVASAALVAVLVGMLARGRLGGITGDVCGAAGELAFAAQLIVLSAGSV